MDVRSCANNYEGQKMILSYLEYLCFEWKKNHQNNSFIQKEKLVPLYGALVLNVIQDFAF